MDILQLDLTATADLPDPEALDEPARQLRLAGTAFETAVTETARRWQGLDGLYDAPHKHLVLGAMTTPSRQAGDLAGNTASTAAAIEDFSAALREIRRTRAVLLSDITDAETELANLQKETDGGFAHNDALINHQWHLQNRADSLAGNYEAARQSCAGALAAISRASSDVPVHYSESTLDLQSHDAERLHRQATGPGATRADIRRYYDFLAGMDPARYAEFAAGYPESAAYPPRLGLPAQEQAQFWNSLSAEQQEALAAHLPAVAGNTEGVPYAVRAAANAAVLAVVLKPAWRASADQWRAFRSIEAALKPPGSKSENIASLVSFDPGEPPLAAVALGNLDTAANITVNVSGMGSSTQDMEGAVAASRNIYDEQGRISSAERAVVAWIGYDSPEREPSTEVLLSDKARTGGAKLATVLDGIYQTRGADVPRVSVTAHSYGTTTAAYALTQTSRTIDAVVFYGSAGIDPESAASAADLHAEEVYATQGSRDVVAPLGIIGSRFGDPRLSPTEESWGAKVFSADGTMYPGTDLRSNGGHGLRGTEEGANLFETELGAGYLDRDTATLWGIAAASAGEGDKLQLIRQAPTDTRLQETAGFARDVYYAPGRTVDALQTGTAAAVDSVQENIRQAGPGARRGLRFAVDAVQEAVLPDAGPFGHPLDPLVDAAQNRAEYSLSRAGEAFHTAVDASQIIVEELVDSHQKAADEYFKKQWRVLEFVAGRLVAANGGR